MRHCSIACSHEMSLCTELPLILFDCEFGGEVDWVYEADCHEDNIQHLQQTWAQHAIKYVCLFISLALSTSQSYDSHPIDMLQRLFCFLLLRNAFRFPYRVNYFLCCDEVRFVFCCTLKTEID